MALSPIRFSTCAALTEKLRTYKVKKNKHRFEVDLEYVRSIATFGHSRLLFHLLRNPLKTPASRYGIPEASAWSSSRIVSLAFNISGLSDSKDELLDIGWTTVVLDGSGNQPTYTNDVHLISGNVVPERYVGIPFLHGEQRIMDWPNLVAMLHNLLDSATPTSPLVLLVYDLEATTSILNQLYTSTNNMHTGLSELLNPRQEVSRANTRDRSRSPQRNPGDPRSRRRSPPPRPIEFRPIHLVDVRELYHTMRTIKDPNSNVSPSNRLALHKRRGLEFRENAGRLNVRIPPLTEGCCAGNESRALAQMWLSMAGGEWVNNQYKELPPSDVSPLASATDAANEDDEDDYIDPADRPRAPMQNTQQQNQQGPGGFIASMDSWDDDAEDEY
ncbi:hypothetical protein OF83DRAFT_125844 [Amylostereum chailletii]|nr:hypothetical protein OF83DRAFT_125844 [Amylostereum chailletii]